MSRAGKPPKGKKVKGQTADREEETRFIEDGADTGQKTGHGKSPGASAVSRSGDGPVETSSNADHEASGEGDPLKKRKKSFGKRMMSFGRSSSNSPKALSKKNVQSPTSSLAAVGDAGGQSEATESHGTSASGRKPSTVSSCDSQASGGLLSPTTEQTYRLEESRIKIQELEQKLLNSEDTSSRLEEEVQRREQEYKLALADLEGKHTTALEKLEKSQQQYRKSKEEELEVKENLHTMEMGRALKQHQSVLANKDKALTALLRKQQSEKDETIKAKDSELKKLREELDLKDERFHEEQQQVRNSQAKIQESQLQILRDELTEKDEELQMKLREKETIQLLTQKVEKQLQECQTQLQQQQERHAQEKKQMTGNYETQLQEAAQQHEAEKDRLQGEKELLQQEQDSHAQEKKQITEGYETQLQEAAQQHEAEKERLLGENQWLQQEQKRYLEEMADKQRQYEEQQQKDIPQQSAQETDQMTKGHETQKEQLKLQHKRALEEKDRQLAESRSRLQERYDKDMTKRTREFQAKLADAERRHKTQLEDKQKQYDSSVTDVHKRQHDALQVQVAQMKRSHEKELQRKEEENTRKMEQEIQRREQVLREELQQKEQALQELREQMLQQTEQELQQHVTQLRQYEQEVIEKDAKIAQLESDLSVMVPSSDIPPSEESPSGSKDQSATSHRVPVQSRNEIVADLHSNVVDMAREISHYVDPENVLPSVQCCHHLTPPEVKRVVEVLGGQGQLREYKPQNYCFAVLPSDNQKQSVLFDYTGTFRPSPDDEVCPLHGQEEEGFHTPPSTPNTEVPRMLTPDADASNVAANLPDSEKVNRLRKALDGHLQLHADMEEKVKSKTEEIADLRREMDARDEELRARGEEIQALKESVQDKEQEIEEKLQSIEDFHKKVEQRDRQLDYLKKRPNGAELSPKALEEYDLYFDHVLKLTEELTDSEATIKKQQREIENHKKLVERAERMEEQATRGAVELSEKDQEIKELNKRAQHTAVPKDEEPENGGDRLRSFQQETEELETQLEKVQSDLHGQCQQKSELESKVKQLEEDMSVKGTELEAALHELEDLKEENGKLELQLMQRELRSQGASEKALQVKREEIDFKVADQVKVLQEKLRARDEELEELRQQATGSGIPLQASLKYDDLPTDTDPRVEIAMLKQALESKEQKVESLQVQVRSFEGFIKQQSKQVVKLKQELTALKKENEALKGEKMPLEERRQDQTGTDLVSQLGELKEKLAITEDEKLKMEQERECYKTEVEQLRGDLEVTRIESAKEGTRKSEKGEALVHRLQLAAQKSEQDQLRRQLEQTEATVRQLETDLNLSQARVAELEGEITAMNTALSDAEANVRQLKTDLNLSQARVAELEGEMTKLDGGITGMKTALSESEHHRRGLFQELSKVREQRDALDQKCLSLLALNENLKSQAAQVDCAVDEITKVKHEASQWKETLSTKGAEVGALKKENEELKEEIAARKAEAVLWAEDFQKERHDREQAAGRIDDERAHLHIQSQQVQEDLQKFHTRIHQLESENKRLRDEIRVHQAEKKNYQQVMTNFDDIQLQLVQHKDQVANLEQLLQAQQQEHKAQLEQGNRLQRSHLDDVHRQLRQSNQQLDQAVTDNEKLNDDVLAKTQQVKQYKKQVDGLKAEVAKYKKQVDGLKAEVTKYKSQSPAATEELDMQTAISESKQTEAARQLEEVTRNLQDATRRSEELRGERDALLSEVEQLKSGKMNQLHFSAAFQKEFEKRGEFQEKYKKEFEVRGEFESKYHQVMDRCAELFEQVQQLRGVLEHHQIKIPDPPPKQRAPPADVPRAGMQQPQGLMSRSSEGDMHPPAYHGDPAAHHTSPRLARPDPRSANVPPEVRPQQYEFRQPPTPIQPLPQQGVDQIYEPHEQAWVHDQPYNPEEQAPDMMYQAPGHAPQQHVRGQPHREEHYDEGMCRENEAITKDLAVKLQIEHERENIEALMAAQQRAEHHPEQDHQFHPEHEMAHQHHHGHMRQGYSVDDPRYAPVQHQDGMGPSGHSSLPTSSITAPQLRAGRPDPHPLVHPSDRYVPGISQCGDLAISHRMHGLQHQNEVVAAQQRLENVHFQKQIEQEQILQAQEQMRAQQQMVRMEAQNAHGQHVLQPVQGYPSQGYQGYQHMEDYLQMQGHPQMQPGMVVQQHQLGAYHGQQPPAASPRLYGDSPLPQSHPRRPMPGHNVPQPLVSPHLLPAWSDQYQQQPVTPNHPPPGSDQEIPGEYPAGMQPAVSPRHPPPGSDQGHVPDQYAMGMQPRVTPSTDQPPQGQYPQEQYPQGEPITPTEEVNPDHAAKISKPVEESCPDRPEQRQKQPSAQQDENKLMKGLDTEIHDTAVDVEANVQSKEELESLQGAPMDPNLVCPMCDHGYRVGEIQKYRRHVKSCHGSN